MTIQCPKCHRSNTLSKSVLSSKYRCIRCGSIVGASVMYLRVVSVLSMVLVAAFLWAVHVRLLDFFIWAIPMWLLVLWALVRVVPYLVPPRLELRDSPSVTTLGLSEACPEHHLEQTEKLKPPDIYDKHAENFGDENSRTDRKF